MWRSLTGEGPGGGSGTGAATAPGGELTSGGFHAQESPLLGLFPAVSRPAMSFLQRYLPGRVVKRDFLKQNSEFLRRFDDILPSSQLNSLPWFNLQKIGLDTPEEMSLKTGFSSSAQTVVSHAIVNSQRDLSKSWWGSFWRSDEEQKKAKCLNSSLLCAENGRPAVFVQELAESAGGPSNKGTIPQLRIIHSLSLGSDLGALTPEQDHGYFSLEEELLLVVKAQQQGALQEMEEASVEQDEEKHEKEEEPPVLKCDNKAIAFIMGCPCSDDSQSESSEEDSEDDDGFDSDCSSHVSDSDEDEEEGFDSEAERLWSALCQDHDPYNPRNFTARIETAPKPIPKLSPVQVQSSPGSSSSSSSSSSSWDEASETDEYENLLRSFGSSDPYSPLNFQAQIRTKGTETKTGLNQDNSGFSERAKTEQTRPETRATNKKVRFCDDVQFFFIGSEEDRRGPWEEFARDRGRFLRRCHDTEKTIGFCFSPEHRLTAYRRVCSQSEPSQVQTGQSEAGKD